jgi:hypothetical protein
MSYYQGDYMQGDPGFLSGFGKLASFAAGFIPGAGGVVGKLTSKILGSRVGKAIAAHPTLSAAGAAGATGVVSGMAAPRMLGSPAAAGMAMTRGRGVALVPGGGAPGVRGFHLDKKTHSHMVRNRRMRVTNPRALRRAIRRAKGFERLARKVMHFVSPRKTRGRAVFRGRRTTRR